ncbi:MAG TPA: lantibiotic dehydratase [Kofleriaceae bacterium]|nr:lantibiotic dehydratase [Kofleriaceae bacterium]
MRGPGPGKTMKGRKEAVRPPYADGGFFVLRSPLLPLDEFYRWGDDLERRADDEALARDAARVRARLRALVQRPEIREAIFVASPGVEESLDHWLRDPDGERGQKVERSLYKYMARMAMRSTPFGLFAGGSVGRIADQTSLVIGRLSSCRRHTRLDGDYLDALCRALLADPAVRAGLTVRPNSSLYAAAGRLRLAEARLVGKVRSYHLVAIEPDHYLTAVLERAAAGARPGELAGHLVELDPEISVEEASTFIDELIDNQILLPDLTPAVTGPAPLDDMLAQLSTVPAAAPAVTVLERARDAIAALDQAGLGNDPARYRAIADDLGALPAPVELPRLFQVDMTKPAPELTLSRALLADVVRGVDLLRRLSPAAPDPLQAFREQWNRRYEGREVPLCEVLDEESGIGFARASTPGAEAAPLLAGIPFGGGQNEARAPVGPAQRHLADLLSRALARGEDEVVLGDDDLTALENKSPPPAPDAFQMQVRIGAASPEAMAQGDVRLYISSFWGPSGAMMLGRFCHADPDLFAHVIAHLRAEEAHRPDAIFAEIVHLPEGRLGNVIFRPVLRDHEIPFLGRAGVPRERQIPVTDLLVSVRGSRIVLRSRALGVEIVPRLTTAHNFSGTGGLGLYRFLCTLQAQVGAAGLDFGAFDLLPFRPRVSTGRFVIATRRWRVDGPDLERLGAKTRSGRFAAVQALREKHRMPRHVLVMDGDNHLPIDLENVLAVEALAALVKGRPSQTFGEIAPGPDEAILRGPDGRFQHEIVIPFHREARTEVAAAPRASAPAHREHRVFAPGSEWLYAKLYTGSATADQVLRELVAPVVADMRAAGVFDRWFFIRYDDPDHHLRVRFRGSPARLAAELLPALHAAAAPFMAGGRLGKIQLDTYEPEWARYGGPAGLDLGEKLFAIDSDACLAILDLMGGDEGLDAAWRLTLVGIDQLLRDLGLDLDERHRIARNAATMLRGEYGSGEGAPLATAADKALGDRFRKERASLEQLFDPARRMETVFAPGIEVLDTRSRALAPVVAALREAERAGALTSPIAEMAWSYAHMFANRMLRGAPRAQEMVLYDFLARLYESQKARAKGKAKASK